VRSVVRAGARNHGDRYGLGGGGEQREFFIVGEGRGLARSAADNQTIVAIFLQPLGEPPNAV